MRKLLTLCLLVLSVSVSAQWQLSGAKVRYVNGLGIPTKDTAAGVLADSSQILIRPQDSSLYVKYKRTWVKVGGGTISGTTNYVSKFTSSTAIGNSLIYDDGSYIGIGTTTPSAKLDVHGAGVVQQINGTGTNNAYLDFQSAGTTQWRIGSQYATAINRLSIFNAGGVTEALTILQNGSVGISTINPSAKLDVSGSGGIRVNEDGIGTKVITIRSNYAGVDPAINVNTNNSLLFLTNNTERMRIASGGNVLIGTTTDNGTDKLQVNGSAIASTLKVNTSGQTVSISSFYNGGAGKNIWIGGGGLSSTTASESNVSLGYDALLNNTSGYLNVGIGGSALKLNTTGFYNFGIGGGALEKVTTGNYNTAIGVSSLANTTSSNNTAIGSNSMALNTTGANNVAIGTQALFFKQTGSSNIAIGYDAGRNYGGGSNLTSSSQLILIGEDTRPSADGNTNEIVIGHTNIGQGSNSVTLGNSSITKTFLRGSVMVNTTSDNGTDKLQVSGSIQGTGFNQNYVTKTGTYTAGTSDYVIDCTSGTFTVNLFTATGNTGRILIIKNSGTGTITVDPSGAQTVDGASTYSLSAQYATVQIVCDGTNWKIISKF